MAWPEKTVVDSLPLIDSDAHKHVIYLNTNSSFNTFNLPLDDPSVVLISWDGESHQRWKPTREWTLLNSEVNSFSF